MTQLARVSLHGHSEIGSHGENIYHESDVSLDDSIYQPRVANYIPSKSDHDSTKGLYSIFERIGERNLDQPYISQIEISTPAHLIVSGPKETILGIEKELGLRDILLRNKSYLKSGDQDAVVSSVEELLDKVVGGMSKVAAGLPHMIDTLKSGIVGKYTVEGSLRLIKHRHMHYLEGYNGMNSNLGNYCNFTLAVLAKELYGKHIFVGADYHNPNMMGTNLNVIEVDDLNETSILKSIINGKVVAFENLKSSKVKDILNWSLNRIKFSRDDMIRRTYIDDWTKDSSWSKFTKIGFLQKLARLLINYAHDSPDSKLWPILAKFAEGVNRGYEVLSMSPKYRKILRGMTDDRVDYYGPVGYKEFKKDPLAAFGSIANVFYKPERTLEGTTNLFTLEKQL